MQNKAFLAWDMGAESGRAMMGVISNDTLTLHEMYRFQHQPQQLPSGLHWNVLDMWRHLLEGTRKAVAWAKQESIELVSLGVDTWGVDCALVGKSGQLLGIPFAYRDSRFQAAMEKTLKTLGEEYLYGKTGIQFMPFNTLFQLVALNDDEPHILKEAQTLLFIPDLLHYFFTGVACNESSIASTSQMIDPRTGQWATELLEKMHIPVHILGKIVPSGSEIGPLLPHVAAEVGAEEGLKVVAPACHDTADAIVAVPADASTNWAYLSSGTWSLIGVEAEQPSLSEAARAIMFTNEGGINRTIRFLKNITGLWLVQQCRREFEKRGEVCDYQSLTELAAKAEPFRTLIDPDHAPFLSPGNMPEKIAEYAKSTGQPVPQDTGQLVRCCLESLALTYRLRLGDIEELRGQAIDVLHVIGGGGQNRLLNQMTADATGKRVVVGPVEATATGNVLVQAMTAGVVKDLSQARRIVSNSFELETYEPTDTDKWESSYERFLKLLEK
jgi:rhamnulokinase